MAMFCYTIAIFVSSKSNETEMVDAGVADMNTMRPVHFFNIPIQLFPGELDFAQSLDI